MNFSPLNIAVLLAIIVVAAYVIIVLRRAFSQNFSFVKALNPFYTKEMQGADAYKESLSPIVEEIETKRVANFVKHWFDKFENNQLTVQDVLDLNAKIEAGAATQVNGILAIHPEAKKMFNKVNADIKLKEAALAVELEEKVPVIA